MLSYIIILLLIVNFIMLLVLFSRSFGKQEPIQPQTADPRVLENQRRFREEIYELKKAVAGLQAAFEKESERRRNLDQSAEAAGETAPVNKQKLFLYDRYKEIFDLHVQGLSAEEIAKKLDRGYGEIAFILDLAAKDR